jgi:hypothetical protein
VRWCATTIGWWMSSGLQVDWRRCRSGADSNQANLTSGHHPKPPWACITSPPNFPHTSSVRPICCSQWQDRDNSGVHMLTPVILVPTRLIIAARYPETSRICIPVSQLGFTVSSTLASIPGHQTCPAYFWLLGCRIQFSCALGMPSMPVIRPLPSHTRISCQVQV